MPQLGSNQSSINSKTLAENGTLYTNNALGHLRKAFIFDARKQWLDLWLTQILVQGLTLPNMSTNKALSSQDER